MQGHAGLANGIVYDVLLDNTGIGNATVNATSINTDCALVAGLVYDTTGTLGLRTQGDEKPFLFPLQFVPWKDQVIFGISGVVSENVLNFYVTTAIEGSAALLNRTTIPMNWTYYTSLGDTSSNISSATIDMSWVTCNMSILRTSAIVGAQSQSVSEAPVSPTWTSVLPDSIVDPPQETANESWFIFPFDSALPAWIDGEVICSASEASAASDAYDADSDQLDGCGYQPSMLDAYLMQLLGMNASKINPYLMINPPFLPDGPAFLSNTTPSFTLSVDQMETALSRVLATTMWTAGQLDEVSGGFDHSIGSATITRLALETRLNINWIPLSFALSASIILLVLAIRMTHSDSDSENPPKAKTVNSGGVLELIWLASRMPAMRDAIGRVDSPNVDDLRAAGRFDVLLADVGEEDSAVKHYDDWPQGVVRPQYTSTPIEDPTTLRETVIHRLLDDGEFTLNSVELNIKRVHSEIALKVQELVRLSSMAMLMAYRSSTPIIAELP
ncbi:hypothetical protein BV22DRAFT_1135347 [Leucogyrophana mollusca]|uniref:Uncharacterized protein n=1 Tax=Leucogyrophana mollusca TaxID=85980 RepID=A0ACB8AW85_9AGAM|nr:hypothetical protein BV22DRAFT_1135347 [Leucogyrophana mollusca]